MEELDIPSTCQITGWEEIIRGNFGDRKGYFVEVGAYDGLTFSNTWPLAKTGWSGLYIEPIEELYVRCVNNHSKHKGIQVYKGAIGAKDQIKKVYTDGKELYTMDRHMAKTLGADQLLGKLVVEPLDLVLCVHNVPEFFDLLVIDVEGMELEVLQGFSIEKYRPWMVIIEAHEKNTNERMRVYFEEINKYFLEEGYSKIYSDNVNNIYVA